MRGANSPNEETIDHFRPRSKFPGLSFDWLNLVYACRRCNDSKDAQWPEPTDQVNQVLQVGFVRFKPVDRYVDPNWQRGQPRAQDYFGYDVRTGEIHPEPGAKDRVWSIAFRMIRDVDLNDENLGEYDPRNLRSHRLRHLNMLKDKLLHRADSEMIGIALEFTSPEQPFSSFVNAYFRRTFPMFDQIFPP